MIVITDGTGNATMTCFSPQTDDLIKDVDALLQEVANKDPTLIPSEILALQNTRHVFQFRYAAQVAKDPPTFVLQKVMDHPPGSLPALADGPSSTSLTLAYTHTPTQDSPPPATPSAKEDTLTNTSIVVCPPSSSTFRKELCTTTSSSPPMTEGPSSAPPILPDTEALAQICPPLATPLATEDAATNTSIVGHSPSRYILKKQPPTTTPDNHKIRDAKNQKKE